MIKDVQKFSAFSDGNHGGNPAGVWIGDVLPDATTMQQIATEVGFSETVFATPIETGWRVHYFSPESEVPFCGHATIALGAALSQAHGDGLFHLTLNNAEITVEGQRQGSLIAAALQSPATRSEAVSATLLADTLALFGYTENDVDRRIPPAIAHGGANHVVIVLNSREKLSAMRYDLDAGRSLMRTAELATIVLAFSETPQLFHTRNPFASGGVYEDPATGAAAAAFAGYLRDIAWPHGGAIDIIQGEDMGHGSRLHADIPRAIGSSIRVSGTVRLMDA